MDCPSCHVSVAEGATECRSCGIIFARWRPRAGRRPTLDTPLPAPARRASPRLGLVAVLGIVGATLVAGGYWYFAPKSIGGAGRKNIGDIGAAIPKISRLKSVPDPGPNFDLALDLPGSPQGIATDGKNLVIGNRTDPWGAIRVSRIAGLYSGHKIPILETEFNQKMGFDTLAWNGTEFVGYTTAGWYGRKEGHVFTFHDAGSLQVRRHVPAPEHLGCLTWDGSGYWAATRRNTADSPEPALLYRLDPSMKVTKTYPAPAVGCQGLAWDGLQLWFADVFDDDIFVIDVSGDTPRVVHRAPMDLEYMSGIAWFDRAIWIVDYGENRLRRLRDDTRVAWSGGRAAPSRPAVAVASALSSADAQSLRKMLRSEEWPERMKARMELDRMNAPIDFARDQNNFVEREADDTELIDWSVELRGSQLVGSWTIWFGPTLFERGQQGSSIVTIPQFARYEITVRHPGGRETKKEFEAVSGDNVMRNVGLADADEEGEYDVSIFMHVQYVSASGEARILNNSTSSLELRR